MQGTMQLLLLEDVGLLILQRRDGKLSDRDRAVQNGLKVIRKLADACKTQRCYGHGESLDDLIGRVSGKV